MNIDANDPKWTQYALGEITDEREKIEIERLLAESPEMRQLVEDIRQTAGMLKRELLAEPIIGLTPAQRKRIEAKANTGGGWFRIRPAWVTAVAAALVMMISVVTYRELRRGEELASKDRAVQVVQQSESASIMRNAENPSESKPDDAPIASEKDKTSKEPLPASRRLSDAPVRKLEESIVVNATAPPLQLESSTSVGSVPSEKKAAALPLVSSNTLNAPPAALGSGVSAGNLEFEKDGVAIVDAAGQSGRATLKPNEISAFKMALSPVELTQQHKGWWPPVPPPWQRQRGDFNAEAYANITDNPFLDVTQNPLSTFSIDVDTASYSNVRRFLDGGKLPPKDAVRIEELVNYFDYDYKGPKDNKPFAANIEITEAPWKPEHKLLRIGLKAREIAPGKRPNSNLVFLIDVSGSMADNNKLPLVKQAMMLLVDQLTESDRVAIVVYASDTSVYLPSTSGNQKEKLRHAIERLHAGGSTNGASGIQLAYQTARDGFIQGGANRVILATDGDFNVGITNQGDLTRLIEEKAKSGIFLSALGFGMGNYKDSTLELLATKGRGNYAYIDNLNEAKKVLVEQINAILVSIAKDVKIQIEFNPQRISTYRLIGYEDRVMAKEDFNDDSKQAGVIGSGHAVTALYELVPVGASESKPGVDPLKYQKPAQISSHADSDELLTVKIRSKEPEGDKSVLSEFAVKDSKEKFAHASRDFRFAASVAAFGMVLRDSAHKGNADLERALEWAKSGKGEDAHGYRQEFIRLIHRAISISD
jgi:Ca-activated chloride channel family protein